MPPETHTTILKSISYRSLKNMWPQCSYSIIRVYDAVHDVYGTASFDGWNFHQVEWKDTHDGSLFLKTHRITHWDSSEEDGKVW